MRTLYTNYCALFYTMRVWIFCNTKQTKLHAIIILAGKYKA